MWTILGYTQAFQSCRYLVSGLVSFRCPTVVALVCRGLRPMNFALLIFVLVFCRYIHVCVLVEQFTYMHLYTLSN
jgi:hypothetical protein